VAERRDALSGLGSNSNQALRAIPSQTQPLDRALSALPPALRQSNTTFSNLRDALDDLDPLVETSKPATRDLAPFLNRLRIVLGKSVPVFGDLRLAVNRRGKANDLADAAAKLAPLRNAADRAVEPAVQAMQDSEETLTFLRAYSPELMGAITRLGQFTAHYDADGNYARIQAAGQGLFDYNEVTNLLEPIPESAQFDGYGVFGGPNWGIFKRCPGGATQPAEDGSSPFVAPAWPGSELTSPAPPGDCDATDVLPGP